jgi:pimeloyl-ACP methyl ester carboxylesterase
MTVLVVLPGLDDTGILLREFADAAGAAFSRVVLVSYPVDQALGYAGLEAIAEAALPRDERFVLLGESFSGPLALALAARTPPGLVGLVLSTTFARSPIGWASAFAPLLQLSPSAHYVPTAALGWWLLGPWATRDRLHRLREALGAVAPAVITHRAIEAARADARASAERVAVPTLFLRATSDRLLAGSVVDELQAKVAAMRIVDLDGPHMLLQAQPEAAARAVAAFAAELEA